MYTVKPESFDPVRTICDTYQVRMSRAMMGSTQKEQARATGERMGFQEGLSEALAWFLTVRRVERYGKWDYVSAVESYACSKFLQDYVTAWDQCYGDLPANVNDESYEDKKAEADLKFAEWYDAALHVLTFPHDMEQLERERHQQAVLDGKEPATEQDKAWIQVKLDEQHAEMERLNSILKG